MLRNKKERTHCGVRGSSGNRRGTPDGRTATPASRPTEREGKRIGWRESWYLRRSTPQIRGVRFQPKYVKRERTRVGVRSLLVDLRGIEPLSENRRYDFLRGQSLY